MQIPITPVNEIYRENRGCCSSAVSTCELPLSLNETMFTLLWTSRFMFWPFTQPLLSNSINYAILRNNTIVALFLISVGISHSKPDW